MTNELVTVEQVHKYGSKAEAAVSLRSFYTPWEDITEQLGYANVEATKKAVEHALANSIDAGDKKRQRQFMNEQLNRMVRAIRTKALDPNHPDQISALRTLTAILDRKSKLNGLDEPTQVAVTTPSDAKLREWAASMIERTEGSLPQEADVIEGEVVDDDVA